ncbi:1610_t:CDS:2 [Paraglomus brasilianum]|uniref:1610_t:CDS:1 n=1 Tax=Paraglomus brasilianum TaxID=144538 RepID=A0A9N9D9T2_9GLOM|nr:1610_t:CDS:2 [Paraglomus brasilianum]
MFQDFKKSYYGASEKETTVQDITIKAEFGANVPANARTIAYTLQISDRMFNLQSDEQRFEVVYLLLKVFQGTIIACGTTDERFFVVSLTVKATEVEIRCGLESGIEIDTENLGPKYQTSIQSTLRTTKVITDFRASRYSELCLRAVGGKIYLESNKTKREVLFEDSYISFGPKKHVADTEKFELQEDIKILGRIIDDKQTRTPTSKYEHF